MKKVTTKNANAKNNAANTVKANRNNAAKAANTANTAANPKKWQPGQLGRFEGCVPERLVFYAQNFYTGDYDRFTVDPHWVFYHADHQFDDSITKGLDTVCETYRRDPKLLNKLLKDAEQEKEASGFSTQYMSGYDVCREIPIYDGNGEHIFSFSHHPHPQWNDAVQSFELSYDKPYGWMKVLKFFSACLYNTIDINPNHFMAGLFDDYVDAKIAKMEKECGCAFNEALINAGHAAERLKEVVWLIAAEAMEMLKKEADFSVYTVMHVSPIGRVRFPLLHKDKNQSWCLKREDAYKQGEVYVIHVSKSEKKITCTITSYTRSDPNTNNAEDSDVAQGAQEAKPEDGTLSFPVELKLGPCCIKGDIKVSFENK